MAAPTREPSNPDAASERLALLLALPLRDEAATEDEDAIFEQIEAERG